MQRLQKLPELLAWRMGLPLDQTQTASEAYYENMDFCDDCLGEPRPITVKPSLMRLGMSDGWNGAPAHLPQLSMIGDKVYNAAFTPAVIVNLPYTDGLSFEFAMNASTCEEFGRKLIDAASKISKWENDSGEREIQKYCRELTLLLEAPPVGLLQPQKPQTEEELSTVCSECGGSGILASSLHDVCIICDGHGVVDLKGI